MTTATNENKSASYTDADLRCVEWIRKAMSEHQISGAHLSRMTGVANGTLTTLLNGRYPSSPSSRLTKIKATLEHSLNKVVTTSDTPLVETSIFKVVKAACYRAHVYRRFSVIPANVGTGKTAALKSYADTNQSAILIEGLPSMTSNVLIDALVAATDAVVDKQSEHTRGTQSQRLASVINALTGSDRLLIIDEAETLTPGALEHVRRISDIAKIGVVLAGTLRLYSMLRSSQGRFGQISSRVTYWAKPQRNITRNDAYELTRAYMSNDGLDLNDELLDAFWHSCDGSARVLVEGLIPGVRDYVLRDGQELTPESIHVVAGEILGYGQTN